MGVGRIDPAALDKKIQDYQTPVAPPAVAQPQQQAPPTNGQPTSKWARIAQVGVGKVNALNAYRRVVEHQTQNTDARNNPLRTAATDVGHAVKGTAKAGGSVVRAIARPGIDLLSGQGGKLVHDTAQLGSDVTGGSANYLLNASIANPAKEAAGILSGNKKAATNATKATNTNLGLGANGKDFGSGFKKLGAEGVLALSTVVGGGEVAGAKDTIQAGGKILAKKVAKDAAIGAIGNSANTIASNPKASGKEVAKSAAIGAAIGGGLPLAAKGSGVLKTVLNKDQGVTDTIAKAKTSALLQKGKEANLVKTPTQKLLSAGEKQPVKGEGFTMSSTADKTAISRGQQITQLQDQLTKFQQGKLQVSPEKAKLIQQQLTDLKSGKVLPTAAEKLTGKTSSALEVGTPKGEVASIKGSAHAPNTTPADETFKNIKMASAKGDTKGFFKAVHEWFNPVPGKQGAQAQRDLRSSIGGLTQQKNQSEVLARDATKSFGKLSPQEHLQFIQNVDKGAKQGSPELDKLASTLKDFNKGNEQIAKSINPDLQTIEHYTTHSGILDTSQSKSFAKAWSKAPFKGNTGALKERAFPTVADMVQYANEKGIAVKETNPMTLALNSRAGLAKAKMAQDFIAQQTAKGVDPEIVQKVVDRYMEPGLAGNQVYKTLRQAGNGLNSLQLGLSGFHVTGTSINASLSEFSNGINNLLTGHPLKAAASTVRGAYAPADYAVGGRKFIKDLVTGADTKYTQAAKIANFNPVKSNDYIANGLKKSIDDFKSGHIIKGTLTLPGRAISTVAKPLMEHWVPDLKAGAFKRAIDVADTKLGKNATVEARQAAYQKAADSVDNRFGQLNKDNLFWNKTLKDVNTIAMRSPGWNIGTVRELGGGVKDLPGSLASLVKGKGVSERTAYTASLAAGTMMMGAVLQKMFTGKGPTEAIDYFYPKTGKVDKNGNEERVSLPTYSKDVFSFLHSPGSTISNKLNPLVSTGKELVTNKDYFGNQIRNPQDSLTTQAKQAGGFVGKNVLPFSLSNTTQRVEKTPATKAQTAFGLNPAPSYITKSGLSKDVQTMSTHQSGTTSYTPEEQAVNTLKSKARADLSSGNSNSTNLQQLKSQLSPSAYKTFLKTGGDTQVQRQFDKLTTDNKLKIIEKYTPDQLKELDASTIAKSLVGSGAKSVFDTLQSKGYSPDRIKQDLQKIGIDNTQLQQIKNEAKKQSAAQSRQTRRQPKFVNPLVR